MADPAAATPAAAPPAAIRFVDATSGSGLEGFVHVSGTAEKPTIPEAMGGGVAFLDHDRDGDLDVFFTNGATSLEPARDDTHSDALFRNDGGHFVDASAEAGVQDRGWSMGIAVADVDGDAWPDVHVTGLGGSRLLRNDGGARFEDVTSAAGARGSAWDTGATFFDADRDGDLDLHVAGYVDFDPAQVPADTSSCFYRGVMVAYGPQGLAVARDTFLRNEGGMRFSDATAASGLAESSGYGFQSLALDVEDDGDLDLFVANDSVANHLWINDGAGRFAEAALRAGLAVSGDGKPQACMGVASGDADGDGRLDILVTNFSEEPCTLYRADGGGFFSDVTARAGLREPTHPVLSWACAFFDAELDGDLDLFIANGHVYPAVDALGLGRGYRQAPLLLENDGRGRFVDASARAGAPFQQRLDARGGAFADVDADGDVDVLLTRLDGPPLLMRNESVRGGRWLGITLRGRPPNTMAIGARVTVTAGGRSHVRQMHSSEGFLSSNGPHLHVGLGPVAKVEEVRVLWPSGTEQVFGEAPADSHVVLDEGGGLSLRP